MTERLFTVETTEELAALASDRSTGTQGAIAEHRAILELLNRGYRVARPVVDDHGVDLIVYGNAKSVTIQVKSTKGLQPSTGRAVFNLSTCRNSGGYNDRSRADVWLFHLLDADLWWVVPKEVIAELGARTVTTTITPGAPRRRPAALDGWLDRWHLLEELLV